MKKIIHVILILFFSMNLASSSGQDTVRNLTKQPKIKISDSTIQPELSITKTNVNTSKSTTIQEKKKIVQKSKVDIISIQKSDAVTNDTIVLNLKSNVDLAIPLAQNGLTKIVMIKEKSSFDFLKYILPIITLLLGILIKEVLDKRNEKKKIKKSGERWVAELLSLEEPLKKQIQALKEFKEENEKEDFTIPRMKISSSLNGEVFKSLDKNEFIQFVQMKNKKAKFKEIVIISNQIHGYINSLVNLYDSLKEKFNKYLSESSLYTDQLSKSLQEFGVAFADYGVEIEAEISSNPNMDVRFGPISELYSVYITPNMDDGKYNPFKMRKEFFLPVLNILSQNRLDVRTRPMLIATNSALNSIKGIEMEKYYMNEIITKLISYYQSQLEQLDGTIKKISKSTIS